LQYLTRSKFLQQSKFCRINLPLSMWQTFKIVQYQGKFECIYQSQKKSSYQLWAAWTFREGFLADKLVHQHYKNDIQSAPILENNIQFF